MADFIKLEEKYLPEDGDWYKVVGIITEEDIKKINTLPRKTILVTDNTKGLSSVALKQITSDNISFSVIGGLDYFNKEKYKNKEYITRTMFSVPGLTEIVKYYESIESKMHPEWTNTQKCMFLYDSLTRDFTYEENYKTQIPVGITERSLNGIIYKKLVCAGFALVLKEGLDRIGINNIYQNKQRHHSWNIVELGGKLRGLELTWDCYNKGSDNTCQFKYFGLDPNFYANKHHKLNKEIEDIDWFLKEDWSQNIKEKAINEEETEYTLTPFTIDELRANYQVISQSIKERKPNQNPLFNSQEEEIKLSPLDRVRVKYQKECTIEQKYIMLYQFLKNSGKLNTNQYDYLNLREAYILDVLGSISSDIYIKDISYFKGKDIGLETLSDCEFHTNGAYITPYGKKQIISKNEEETITDETALNKMYTQLEQRLKTYTINYLTTLLNNSEEILKQYQSIHAMDKDIDLNLELAEANLYTHLQILITSKDFMSTNGLLNASLNQRLSNIEAYFNSLKQKTAITEEEQRENDIDFLLNIFEDTDKIKQLCEQHDGHHFSDEEWKQKSTNATYMLQVFDKLDIKPENIQIALNKIFINNTENTSKPNGIRR